MRSAPASPVERSKLRGESGAEHARAKRRIGSRLTRCVSLALALAAATSVQADGAGAGLDALPGVHEVPLATEAERGVRARAGASYGWTEAVLEMDDTHHRLALDAAGSFTPLHWLSATVRALGRYDVHGGAGDSDSGVITETHLGARATSPLGADARAGVALDLWLPAGDSIGDAFAAISSDLQLVAAYAPRSSPWTLGLAAGLRMDRSSHAGGRPERYSAADRLALGVSDATWAARLGLAGSYRSGALEWIAEWAYRMYFEQVGASPMWIRAGARYHASDALQLELLLGVSPSGRPSLAEEAPLAVVEPRLGASVSATYRWAGSQPSAAVKATEPTALPARSVEASLSGKVLASSGAPLADAAVTLRRDGTQRDVVSDARGGFAFTQLSEGDYELGVSAPGFTTTGQAVTLRPGDAPELTITLERELPSGQIRGTVRRWSGKPIRATVAIAELGLTQPTREDGSFEFDVQPGEYSVAVTAAGFRQQTRKARVELRGVAILIIELEPSR